MSFHNATLTSFNSECECFQIWNHPDLLLLAQEEKTLRKEDNLENFIVDTDDDVPEVPNGVLDVIPIDLDTGLDETLKGGVLHTMYRSFFFFFLHGTAIPLLDSIAIRKLSIFLSVPM